MTAPCPICGEAVEVHTVRAAPRAGVDLRPAQYERYAINVDAIEFLRDHLDQPPPSTSDHVVFTVRMYPRIERVRPPMFVRFAGDPGLYMATEDFLARVDGGDPGDENDARA